MTFFCELLHVNAPVLTDQQGFTYINSVLSVRIDDDYNDDNKNSKKWRKIMLRHSFKLEKFQFKISIFIE